MFDRVWKLGLIGVLIALPGCGEQALNNPYPQDPLSQDTIYRAFSERPKHFDPARSYSANEYAIIAQVYEPLFQYHYLKRPYTLVPLAAARMPEVRFLDAAGQPLPDDADAQDVAISEYTLTLQPGIRYQPHPAFVADNRAWPASEMLPASLYELPLASRDLTADDYIYQIKRLADPAGHSPIAGIMQQYIVGFAEFAKRQAELLQQNPALSKVERLRADDISGLIQRDDQTFVIRIHGKYPQFKYWLAMPFFAPMPWEADAFYSQPPLIERNLTLDWYPVGTGPYYLAENNPNRRMLLIRNPNFHDERYPDEGAPGDTESGILADAGKALPLTDRVIFTLEKEDIPYWNKFLQGYYDASGISSDSFDQAVSLSGQGNIELTDAMRARGIHLLSSVTTSSFYMGFNMFDPVVGGNDEAARKLRQAISIAVDYEEYISIFLNGRGVPAQGMLPPGIFGFQDGPDGINPLVYQWQGNGPKRRSIDAAKALLREAGYPNGRHAETGEPLVLYFDTLDAGPDSKARLNWLRKQFEKLNLQLVIRGTDYNRFQDKMRNGNAQIYMWGWNADYPDPENFFFLLYGPNAKAVTGGENASNYQNPEYDRLFERMSVMDNGPERQRIIDRMQTILREDAPWLWGFHPKAVSLHHGWYQNIRPNLMANNTTKYLRIDGQQRETYRRQWNDPVWWPLAVLGGLLAALVLPAVLLYRRMERATAL